MVAELHNRGIAFLPSHEIDHLLQAAGADGSVLEQVSKTDRRASGGSNPEEMAALAKIVDREQRDSRRALRETIALLKTDTKNPGLYVLLGHMLAKQEEWPGMASAFSAAIQLDRDFAYPRTTKVAPRLKRKQCWRCNLQAPMATNFWDWPNTMMGDEPSALAEYQQALALGPRAPDLVYYDIGLAREMVHDMEGAMAAWRRAILINPNDWRAFGSLGSAYVAQGNIDEGVLNLRKAKAAAPDRLNVRQNLGAAFCNSGRHAEAITEFEELLPLDPDWNMARVCLAKSLKAVGRVDEAQKVIDEYYRRETQQ